MLSGSYAVRGERDKRHIFQLQDLVVTNVHQPTFYSATILKPDHVRGVKYRAFAVRAGFLNFPQAGAWQHAGAYWSAVTRAQGWTEELRFWSGATHFHDLAFAY